MTKTQFPSEEEIDQKHAKNVFRREAKILGLGYFENLYGYEKNPEEFKDSRTLGLAHTIRYCPLSLHAIFGEDQKRIKVAHIISAPWITDWQMQEEGIRKYPVKQGSLEIVILDANWKETLQEIGEAYKEETGHNYTLKEIGDD